MGMRHEIEKLAYDIFERSGRISGREMEHWIEAERIICSRPAAAGNGKDPVAQRSATPKRPVKKTR
jgi:hypothetical protein